MVWDTCNYSIHGVYNQLTSLAYITGGRHICRMDVFFLGGILGKSCTNFFHRAAMVEAPEIQRSNLGHVVCGHQEGGFDPT